MSEEQQIKSVGEWRIERLLGAGGASEVYEVEHSVYGIRRALKLFKPTEEVAKDREKFRILKERFIAEGKILAKISHPRVVRVHEYGSDEEAGATYFVMDLITDEKGGAARTLADAYADGVDPDQVAVWYEDLREGLAYIHSQKIVHRDLKLENVLIGPDGHAVLTDFGISRVLDRDLREELRIGMVTSISAEKDSMRLKMGSRGYFSPELERGEEATPASDWYALGVVVFRLLTGIWYEPGMDIVQMLDTYDPLWTRIVPKLLADRVQARSCLSWRELDEKRRMEDAVAMENALRAARRTRRHAIRYAIAALAAALAAGVFAVVVSVLLYRARARLAIPGISDVCFVSPDAPTIERPGVPSRLQQISALGDAMFLMHETFDNLREGRITLEAATAEIRQLAKEAEGDEVSALFESYYDRYATNYDDMGDTNPLVYLLNQTVKRMEEFSSK